MNKTTQKLINYRDKVYSLCCKQLDLRCLLAVDIKWKQIMDWLAPFANVQGLSRSPAALRNWMQEKGYKYDIESR